MKKSHIAGWIIAGFITFYLLYVIKDDLLYYQPSDYNQSASKTNAPQ